MCGIMGYVGKQDAIPLIIDGLKRLEYRGYDSAGVAVLSNGRLWFEKKEGRLVKLEKSLNGYPQANIGIGHTRWATHGIPSDENSHPHRDCSGNIAVVHNGIIENFARLCHELKAKGHVFSSQTDTEVIAHLVEEYYEGDLVAAVRSATRELEGSYAIAIICSQEPDKIVAVRKDSPLIVGLGDDENFLASDIPAVLHRTNKVFIMDDGEMAVLNGTGISIYDENGTLIRKEIYTVTWDPVSAEKGGYPHFMIKEIREQPRALRDTIRSRISGGKIEFPDTNVDHILEQASKIFIVACGTAYHAGMVGKYVIERLAKIPVEVDIASEFRYREVLWPKNSVMMVVSQSGETADTLAALRKAKREGIKTLAVTNVVGSSVAREADSVLYTWAGPEIAVASTKAYSTQILLMYMLAIYLGEKSGTLAPEEARALVHELTSIPNLLEKMLEQAGKIERISRKYSQAPSTFFLGRGLDYAVALEGALKLKEISYMHAEAYAAGELKHGTLALIEEGVPVIALATQNDLEDKMMSNIKEVKARKATIIGVVKEEMKETAEECDDLLVIPNVSQMLTPLLTVVPLQLLAYHIAVERGCDVDKPRNLAKSVTVE